METAEFNVMDYASKCEAIASMPDALNLPEEASAVAQFLTFYRPLLPAADSEENLSSVEIADELQTICVISPNDVSRVMRLLGYRIYFSKDDAYCHPRWAMTRP